MAAAMHIVANAVSYVSGDPYRTVDMELCKLFAILNGINGGHGKYLCSKCFLCLLVGLT
jgi:hypothetical protein